MLVSTSTGAAILQKALKSLLYKEIFPEKLSRISESLLLKYHT